jgi:hypothetical protein
MTRPEQPVPSPGQPLRRPPGPRPSTLGVTRLTAVPDTGGPGDVPLAAVQGTLALDLGPVAPAPASPALYAVTGEAAEAGGAGSTERPDAEVRAWAARFAQAVVEVTGGDRPVTQLLRWTSARVYADLGRRVRIMAQNRPAGRRIRTIRPQVRSVHVFQPAPTSAEVSVHVRYGQRSRALAARLEQRNGHWTCTDLLVG